MGCGMRAAALRADAWKGRSGGLPDSARGEFARAARSLGVVVVADEPMARHTTFRIGGPADLFAAVGDVARLEQLADLALAHGLPVTILGGGSNVLVSDAGIRGLVIAVQARKFGTAAPGPEQPAPACDAGADTVRLVADSGVALAGLARWAIREGWSGLEWAVSVPGTVGGAVIGNAGAHGGQISDNLTWVEVAVPGRGRLVLPAAQLEFAYRDSVLRRRMAAWRDRTRDGRAEPPPIVLRAAFCLARGDAAEMAARADAYLARRRTSQPVEPSAGSVFRNPPGDYAGRLIEAVGLKGQRVGGAQVSPRHANFIVNTGDARAADVVELMHLIERRVLEATGIELVPEIVLLGDFGG